MLSKVGKTTCVCISCAVIFTLQGLRDLVMQSQAAIFSMQLTVQNIYEIIALRETLRRSGSKRKKVCNNVHSVCSVL